MIRKQGKTYAGYECGCSCSGSTALSLRCLHRLRRRGLFESRELANDGQGWWRRRSALLPVFRHDRGYGSPEEQPSHMSCVKAKDVRAIESRRGESRSGPDVVGGLRRHTEGLEVFDRGGHKTQLLFSFRGRVEVKRCVGWVSGESSRWTVVC